MYTLFKKTKSEKKRGTARFRILLIQHYLLLSVRSLLLIPFRWKHADHFYYSKTVQGTHYACISCVPYRQTLTTIAVAGGNGTKKEIRASSYDGLVGRRYRMRTDALLRQLAKGCNRRLVSSRIHDDYEEGGTRSAKRDTEW